MKTIKKILSILCILVILISSVFLAFEYIIPKVNREKDIKEIKGMLIDETKDKTAEEIKEEYKKKYPNVKFPDNLLLKYYPLYAKNQDLRGWISIPEFNIDLPIVQGKDNSYYLKKDINKKYSVWGTPFFDYRNSFNPNDKNLIVYGHNARFKTNEMFVPLNNYKTIDGFKKAPIIKCDTIYEEAYWQIFSVFITKGNNKEPFNYLVNRFSNEDFLEHIANLKEKSLYDTNINVSYDDEILTLSTCNYTTKDARLVVVCKKIKN